MSRLGWACGQGTRKKRCCAADARTLYYPWAEHHSFFSCSRHTCLPRTNASVFLVSIIFNSHACLSSLLYCFFISLCCRLFFVPRPDNRILLVSLPFWATGGDCLVCYANPLPTGLSHPRTHTPLWRPVLPKKYYFSPAIAWLPAGPRRPSPYKPATENPSQTSFFFLCSLFFFSLILHILSLDFIQQRTFSKPLFFYSRFACLLQARSRHLTSPPRHYPREAVSPLIPAANSTLRNEWSPVCRLASLRASSIKPLGKWPLQKYDLLQPNSTEAALLGLVSLP